MFYSVIPNEHLIALKDDGSDAHGEKPLSIGDYFWMSDVMKRVSET